MSTQTDGVKLTSRTPMESAVEAARGCKTLEAFIDRLPADHLLAVEWRSLTGMLRELQEAHLGRMIGNEQGEQFQRGFARGRREVSEEDFNKGYAKGKRDGAEQERTIAVARAARNQPQTLPGPTP